jgi:UDPglucose 6-dehydrogenase
MSIAVIGQGFVGGSLTTVFAEKGETVYVYDKAGKSVHGGTPSFTREINGQIETITPSSIAQFAKMCESTPGFSGVYFVCVPTPMNKDGSADLRIVDDVLTVLSSAPYNSDYSERIAVIKSTVPPGSTEKWNSQFNDTGLHVIFNPEFLTESNALNDMRNQTRIILGGPRPWINAVKHIYQRNFPNIPIVKTSATTAEMVKYFTNIQLAMRVILSCELWQVCNALDANGLNIDYDKVVEYARLDKRLGDSHMSVPGSDGIPGARGHCFPKDLNAMIFLAKSLGVDPALMQAGWDKNLSVIPQKGRDWEKQVGRAVSGD